MVLLPEMARLRLMVLSGLMARSRGMVLYTPDGSLLANGAFTRLAPLMFHGATSLAMARSHLVVLLFQMARYRSMVRLAVLAYALCAIGALVLAGSLTSIGAF